VAGIPCLDDRDALRRFSNLERDGIAEVLPHDHEGSGWSRRASLGRRLVTASVVCLRVCAVVFSHRASREQDDGELAVIRSHGVSFRNEREKATVLDGGGGSGGPWPGPHQREEAGDRKKKNSTLAISTAPKRSRRTEDRGMIATMKCEWHCSMGCS